MARGSISAKKIKGSDQNKGVREAENPLTAFSGGAALFHPCVASRPINMAGERRPT